MSFTKYAVLAQRKEFVQCANDSHNEYKGISKNEKIRRKRAAILAAVKQRQSTA